MKRVSLTQIGQKLRREARHWPRWLILTHTRYMGTGLLAGGLILAVLLLLQAFFWEVPLAPVSTPADRRLSLELIDRLELWIEAVEDERREGIRLPARSLFVIDDPIVEARD